MSHSSIPYDILGDVQIKTINYYTYVITLPTTLKGALLLLDPVHLPVHFENLSYLF